MSMYVCVCPSTYKYTEENRIQVLIGDIMTILLISWFTLKTIISTIKSKIESAVKVAPVSLSALDFWSGFGLNFYGGALRWRRNS